MRSGFKKRESGCLVLAPEMRRLHMQFNRKAAFPILAGIRNTKPDAAKKGSRSGTACAAPAFSCPFRPAPLCNAGARLAPAHAPHRRAFRPAHRALRQRLRRAFLLGGCSHVMPAAFVPRDGAPGVQSRQNAGRRTRNARSAAVGCNVKLAAAKKGSRSGAACAAPAFSCPSCAALQCRRPACTGSRTAPAGFSSGTPGFMPKTAPRFLAWRVFTRYAGGVRAARWCAGRSVPPKCGAQNAKRATDCGGVPQFFMERKAPFAAQRSLSNVAANIWKSAMTPNMHKTGTSVYTLRVPARFCADSGGSTAQKRLGGRPSAAEHVAAFNCVRACAAKQSHYTRFSLSIPEKTAKFGKIRVVRRQKPFCAEKNPACAGYSGAGGGR